MRSLCVLAVLGALLATQSGFCADSVNESMDPASAEALLKTQQMLRDPQERSHALSQSSQAQFVNKQAQSLAGSPENLDSIYDLSADVLESLVQKTNGDPAKMK
jgi:hypothetical protein